jgi:DNA processing protein
MTGSGQTAGPVLSERQRLNWLRLIRSENVGPASFQTLINRFGSAEAALAALPELARKGGLSRTPRIASMDEAEAEMEACARFGARLVAVGEPDYPPMLRRNDQPPPLITIRGNAAVGAMKAVSIVGARNASISGVRLARLFASDFGKAGFAVASGLARGIDAAAHQGSLDTGTIAVLAGGLGEPYPPENLDLYARICEAGLAISEMPFGWKARARDFPRRNRLVAALGLGTVVIEAARRSGSLISARLANELGREVFAVPGSPLDPRSEGSNGLIKQGAMLVTNAQEVIDALAPQQIKPMGQAMLEDIEEMEGVPVPGEDERTRVVTALGHVPTPIDEIIHHTGLSPAQVHMLLLELDLAGRLERHAGGSVSLVLADT